MPRRRSAAATFGPDRRATGADLFVGREWERDEVAAAIASAVGQRGELVLISGEAGIGKTRLAHEVIRSASGSAAVWATCWEGDDAPPYWPWMQVVRSLHDVIGDAGESVVHVDRRALSVLAPELADRPTWPDHGDPEARRARLFDAVVGLMAAAGSRQPTIVVLDDLHWADEPSLLLLRHVASRLATLSVAIIGTYRDAEIRADPARSQLLAAIGRSARMVHLAGLDHKELRRLVAWTVGGDVPADWLETLARRTGGNPFFASEVLRLLKARGGGAGDSLASVPPSVIGVVVQRVARLPQALNDMLELAAVVGERFGLDDLARAGRDRQEVLEALDTLGQTGLIEPAAEKFRFVHALVREAIYANLGPVRRARMHQQVGLALEAADGPAETLARHFLAAVAVGETERALRHAVRAGDAALARLAHEDAGAWFDRALELAAPDEELRARLGRAEARRRSGDTAAARADLDAVVTAARRSNNAPLLAQAALGIQRLGFTSGQVHTEPAELLDEAAHALSDEEPDLRALVLSALATELWEHARDRLDDARAFSLEALDLAERAGSPRTLARCLEARNAVLWAPDGASERAAVGERMVAVARGARDPELEATALLLHATALLELGQARWRDALERFFAVGSTLHVPRVDYLIATRRAALALLDDRRDQAAEMLEAASALGERIAEPDAAAVEFCLRWALARFAGTRAELLDARRPRPPTVAVSLTGYVWTPLMLLDAGRQDEARAALEEAAAIPLDQVRRDWIFLANVFDLGEAAIRLAVADVAARCYEVLLPYAGRVSVVGGFVCCSGAVDHHLGLLALGLGSTAAAIEHLSAAVTIHERIGAAEWLRASASLLERARAATRVAVGTLARDGKLWQITWRGSETHVPDAKGIRDLAVLLQRPGEEVHAAELYALGSPSVGAQITRGDAVVDETARAAYRARLAELDRELANAEDDHDLVRAERLGLERDALIGELRRNFDLKGRARRVGDTTERARKAVWARVRDAIALIDAADPVLAAHLRGAVRTGAYCTYQPAEPASWTVRQV